MSQLGAIDAGVEFQLLQTIECCLKMLFHPDRYEWIMMEQTKEAQKLDDVLALQKPNGPQQVLEVYQCKYAMHPDDQGQAITWDWLLANRKGTSLLKRWADSIIHLQQTNPHLQAYIVTNRIPSPEVLMQNEFVSFDQIAAPHRRKIIAQLGGEQRARTALSILRFRFDQPSLKTWSEYLQNQLFGGQFDKTAWDSLYQRVHGWLQRGVPGDGRIRLDDVRQAVGWYHLKGMDENFPIYPDYVEPEVGTSAAAFLAKVEAARTGVLTIAGAPGSGKSTLLSKLVERLTAKKLAVVRHHYYLRPGQQVGDRFSHLRVIEALMSQIMAVAQHALGGLLQKNPDPADFARWLDECGRYFQKNGDALVVVVDGLDHVYREQKSTSELDALFRELLPLRQGVVVVVGTQRVDDPRLPHLLLQHCPKATWNSASELSVTGVRQWVQSQSGGQTLAPGQITNLAAQLHKQTGGHPLVLRYTWQYLEATGRTHDNELKLPAVPQSGVDDYYHWLWQDLPEYAREILHLLAACDWPWTPGEVIAALDPTASRGPELAEGLRRIAHLADATDGRLRPFHSSLLFFVVDRRDHAVHAERLRRLVLRELRTNASEYRRWAYEWRLETSLGNPEPLRAGPTVEWAAAALARCYPLSEMVAIVSEAATVAVNVGDLGRWAELSLIHDRIAGVSAGMRSRWLSYRLTATKDAALADILTARRTTLSDEELVALTDHLTEQEDQHRLQLCLVEGQRRRLVLGGERSARKLISDTYAELARERRVPEALEVLNSLQALPNERRREALRSLVPMLCLEGVGLPPLGDAEPLSLLFLGMQTKVWSSWLNLAPARGDRELWRGQFHRFLLNALAGQEPYTDAWLAQLPADDWETAAHRSFAQLAARLAPNIRDGVPASPAQVVLAAARCGLGSVIPGPEANPFHAGDVLIQIALDLFELQQSNFVAPLVRLADWQAALQTGLCRVFSWLLAFNRKGLRWLHDETVIWWCRHADNLPQVLRWWNEMAQMAILHDRLDRVPPLLARAAADVFEFESDDDGRILLRALQGLAVAAASSRKEQVKAWLVRTIPVGLERTETSTATQLAVATCQALLKVDVAAALQLYHWLLQHEDAEELTSPVLACLIGDLDLDKPLLAAVAATATTADELAALERRAQQGDSAAQALWNSTVALFGLPAHPPAADDEEEEEPELVLRPRAGVLFQERAARAGARQAYPELVQMLVEGDRQASVPTAQRAGQFVLRSFPGRWLNPVQQVLGSTVAHSHVSRRFGPLVAYLTGAGRDEAALSLLDGAFRFLLKSIEIARVPAPQWQPSASQSDVVMDILLARLVSTSATVRERACTALANLLAGDYRDEVERQLLRYAAAQRLESRGLLPLLVWLRVRNLHPQLPLPSADAICAFCTQWSFAAQILLEQLGAGSGRPALPAHSGAAPSGFAPASAFSTFMPSFLPDGEWHDEAITVDLNDPLIKQWSFEWERLQGPEQSSFSTLGRVPVYPADLGETDVAAEIYTSALLRALAWAVDAGHLSEQEARRRAARCLPIDVDLWSVMPGVAVPNWWPRLPDRIDDLRAARQSVAMTLQAHMPRPLQHGEWQLVYAAGAIPSRKSDFVLTLWAAFRPAVRARHVQCAARVINLWAGGPLHYTEDRGAVPADAPVIIDATVPLTLSTYPRWQWWRLSGGLRAPAQLFSAAGLTLVPVANGVEFRDPDGQLLAVWSEWTAGIRDDSAHEFPAAGALLHVRADLVHQVEQATNTRLKWRAEVAGDADEPNVAGRVFAALSIDLDAYQPDGRR